MAIQMRRGAYAQFDPSKMKAGEWAVSTDSDTKKQQIWMCFAPGIVKRMGTVEDFNIEIQRLIQDYLDSMAESVEKAQESAKLATSKAQESSTSASKAKTSETNAKTSESNASNSAAKARASEANAKASETKAKASETGASASASNAKASETNSKISETNAKESEIIASTSATNAKTSETNAKASATSASTSATNAKASETKAKEYEESAHSTITTINEAAEATRLNKEAAARSEANAKASENQALSYKNSASASEQASKTSEANANTYADNASASATSASTSASEASKSKTSSSASASQAKASETNAKTSETNSAKSESEARKYAEQAKEISESLSGALRPLGTINFANLPSTADASSGDMYNITDQFTTNDDFKEGAGNIIPAGSNVYLTVDRYWDVLAGTPVTGVKGNSESSYRRGNVNITPANIGALSTTGEASNTTVKFTESTSRTKPTTGEKISSIVGKIVKFLSDLKTVAFTGSYNDLSNKPLSLPANGGNASTVNGHTVNADVPSGAKFTDTNTWRPLGTTADTACAGNDSRLSNARPASDVSAWAKASSKPSYSKSEVGLGNVDNTADANKSVKYATSAGNASTVNGHTVNSNVPANAKFTDTHVTVADNLTSTSTTSALSANQGRILKNGLDEVNQSLMTIKNDIMGTMIGKICFIYYKHTAGGVVKNKEYFLENVTNLGLSLPLMNTDGKTFPTLTSPMLLVDGGWNTPNGAIAALQLKADGTLSWVSSYSHTQGLTYMGFIAYIAK